MMPPIYVITGLMGSGKSTVSNYLQYRNHYVIKMDDYAKDFMRFDNNCVIALVHAFGKEAITEVGTVNESFIKQVYFKPEYNENRLIYEEMLDNLLYKELQESLESMEGPVFIEIPAFNRERFENFVEHFSPWIQQIIWVSVDEEIRMERLKNRGMDDETIKLRDSLQDGTLPTWDIVSYKLKTFTNNGTEQDLFDQVTDFLISTIYPTQVALKKNYLNSQINRMSDDAFNKFICEGFKNTFGCNSCPFPCDKCKVQK
jgi:dephospho-CoA kinase